MRVGTVGVWAPQLRSRDRTKIADIAGTLDQLGYGAAWVPGGAGGDLFGDVDAALAASRRMTVATGILNIWMHDAQQTAEWHATTRRRHPGRLLLGIGASHAPLVESVTDQTYRAPLTAMRAYLDALDSAPSPVPVDERILAALGPKMLELAAARSLGSHPYLTDPRHTGIARDALGPRALLAPELKVVLETDHSRARSIARAHLAPYLALPNYRRNLLRTGYQEEDLLDGGSNRLVDGVVAWGDVDSIVGRAQDHINAGADHICIQALTADRRDVPVEVWRELAPALLAGTGCGAVR